MCLKVVLLQCTVAMSKFFFSEIVSDYALAFYALLGVLTLDQWVFDIHSHVSKTY